MDRTVGEEAGEAAAAGVEQAVIALHVEERLVLPGKACRRQVLGRRRRPHGDAQVLSVLLLELPVTGEDLGGQLLCQPRAVDDLPCRLGPAGEVGDVIGVQGIEHLVQGLPGAGPVQHGPIGVRGDGEPVGHLDPDGGQGTVHLAQ